MENVHFNPHYWSRSEFHTLTGNTFSLLLASINESLDAIILAGGATEHVLGTFAYGANNAFLLDELDGKGINALVIGHGSDGCRTSVAARQAGRVEFLNAQLVCMASDKEKSYYQGERSVTGEVSFFNALVWGQPDISFVSRGGSLRLSLVHFCASGRAALECAGGQAVLASSLLTGGTSHFTLGNGARGSALGCLLPRTGDYTSRPALTTQGEQPVLRCRAPFGDKCPPRLRQRQANRIGEGEMRKTNIRVIRLPHGLREAVTPNTKEEHRMSKTATGKRILAVLLSLAMLATLCSVVLPLRAGASARETASSVLLGKGQPTTWQNGLPMGAQAFGLTERQDLTGYTHLEFDFYVEDLAAMKRLEGFGELHARVYFTTDAENFLDYGLGTQVIRSGWNHVALNISSGTPVGTVDLTSAKELRIFVDTLPVATQDFRVEVKNIYATKGMQDDAKAMESKLVWNGLEKVWVFNGGTNNRDFGTIWQYEGNAGAPETGADLSGYTHLEFDYTVGDLWDVRGDEKFGDICLRLYTGAEFWHISLSDQILKTGVNHVKVSLDGAPDNISLANITNIEVYVETTTDTWGVSVVKDMPIAAENFYATKNSNTETVEAKYITAGNASKTWAAGNHSGYADTHFGNSPDQFDMSGYDFIEFDYYIDDLEAVKAKGLTGAQIKFYFSGWNPDGSFNWGTAMAYSFGDQLKQSGWNHIKLAMSAGTVLEPSEQYPADWTKVSRAWCVLDPYEGITLDKDVVVAVNNLTVTREVLPSEEGAAAITSGRPPVLCGRCAEPHSAGVYLYRYRQQKCCGRDPHRV